MKTLILNALVINEGKIKQLDILIEGGRIAQIGSGISTKGVNQVIDGEGLYLAPGIIDTQVHFRDGDQFHKATVESESIAAIMGGVTSVIEQPNTSPQVITLDLLKSRNRLNANTNFCNYGVNFGATLTNYDEVMKVNPAKTPGIKVFWGSSTGGMLVNDEEVVAKMGSEYPGIFIFHSEDEATIKQNLEQWQEPGLELFAKHHPLIRSAEACEKSTQIILDISNVTGMRTHIYHITTKNEIGYFCNNIPVSEKQITAEVCVHHLHFTANDYEKHGNFIKCNPAIKASFHRDALWEALLDDRLDVIATDHAPHTVQEKMQSYLQAPSGVPFVQHGFQLMLDYVKQGKIPLETVIKKMCHAPADCFRIKNRGYIREGYWADLVLFDLKDTFKVEKKNIFYKCGHSPLLGHKFKSAITHTFVNGVLLQEYGTFMGKSHGMHMTYAANN